MVDGTLGRPFQARRALGQPRSGRLASDCFVCLHGVWLAGLRNRTANVWPVRRWVLFLGSSACCFCKSDAGFAGRSSCAACSLDCERRAAPEVSHRVVLHAGSPFWQKITDVCVQGGAEERNTCGEIQATWDFAYRRLALAMKRRKHRAAFAKVGTSGEHSGCFRARLPVVERLQADLTKSNQARREVSCEQAWGALRACSFSPGATTHVQTDLPPHARFDRRHHEGREGGARAFETAAQKPRPRAVAHRGVYGGAHRKRFAAVGRTGRGCGSQALWGHFGAHYGGGRGVRPYAGSPPWATEPTSKTATSRPCCAIAS